MKKTLTLIGFMLFAVVTFAQDKVYTVMEFMKVNADQDAAYLETENFWEKIHEQRIKNGDLVSWELWSLKPGGEDQGYQYITISTYKDRVKMFADWGDMTALAKKAFPKMTDEEIRQKFDDTNKTRNLAIRDYLEQIDRTDDNYDYPPGTVATITMMKATSENASAYEKAEMEFFKPSHQTEIEKGQRASWKFFRFVSPTGSDTYASHITMNVYKDYAQVFSAEEDPVKMTDEQQKIFNDNVATREMKYVHMATLLKRVD